MSETAARQTSVPHHIIIENRKNITATGILSIVTYDANGATLETSLGTLQIGGQELCVSELSVQTGEVKISGDIEFVQYSAPKRERAGLLQRLVR